MPLTKEQRVKIVTEAESWLGTPYVGWSRRKGRKGGVDCGQLLAGVYQNVGLAPMDMDIPRSYSLQIAQHRDDTEYINKVLEYMREIPESEVQSGDVVLYKLGLAFAHAGIVIEWPRYIVHAIGGHRHGVCGGDGKRQPLFRHCERKFFTLRDDYCTEKR